MPTAGRLAGAVFFALYGWYIAGISVPFFPEANAPSYLVPLCAGLGLFQGWQVFGRRSGKGYNAAIGHGLTVAAAFSFWVLFTISFVQMMKNAMRHLYGGPMEALIDTFSLMAERAAYFLDAGFIATVLIGGVVCALAAEYFAKRYP